MLGLQEDIDRLNLNGSGPFSDIRAVELCMCFVPLILIWLIKLASRVRPSNSYWRQWALHAKNPTDSCGSYKPRGLIWRTDCWCKLPKPHSHHERSCASVAPYACKYLASPWTLQLPKAKLPNLQPTLNPFRVFSLIDFRWFRSESEMNTETHASFVLGTLHVGILPRTEDLLLHGVVLPSPLTGVTCLTGYGAAWVQSSELKGWTSLSLPVSLPLDLFYLLF